MPVIAGVTAYILLAGTGLSAWLEAVTQVLL